MGAGRWIPLLLVAITLLCFGRLFKGEFTLLDDNYVIEHNPRLNPPTWQQVRSFWPPFLKDGRVNAVYGLYMPLTYTVWSGVASVAQTSSPHPAISGASELNPYLFHALNVSLHAIGGVLVYSILRLLLRREWSACAGAMVFLLHPVQVEAVGWVSGTKDVLAGVMSLLGVWAFVQMRIMQDRRTEVARHLIKVEDERIGVAQATCSRVISAYYTLLLLASIAALLSKPSAITIPLILLTIDVVLLNKKVVRSFVTLSPIFLTAFAFALLGAIAQPAKDVLGAPIWARPFVVGDALAFYLYKLIVPVNLAVDYGRRPEAVMSHIGFYLTWVIPACVMLLAWRCRNTHPLLLCGVAIFAMAAAPTLGFVTFLFQGYSTTADHYLYLSMLGASMVVAELTAHARAKIATPVVIAIIVMLGTRTLVQTGVWQSNRALFEHTLKVNPRSFMARANLSAEALRDGDVERAKFHLEKARTAEPQLPFSIEELERGIRAISP